LSFEIFKQQPFTHLTLWQTSLQKKSLKDKISLQ